ncbi:MAG: hypothetical protein ACI841_004106 [Planctomycetota bacterium]|jgi:hypothetical protein
MLLPPTHRSPSPRRVDFGDMIQIQQTGDRFITDYEVFDCKPAEPTLVQPALMSHKKLFGYFPESIATDKGRERLTGSRRLPMTLRSCQSPTRSVATESSRSENSTPSSVSHKLSVQASKAYQFPNTDPRARSVHEQGLAALRLNNGRDRRRPQPLDPRAMLNPAARLTDRLTPPSRPKVCLQSARTRHLSAGIACSAPNPTIPGSLLRFDR